MRGTRLSYGSGASAASAIAGMPPPLATPVGLADRQQPILSASTSSTPPAHSESEFFAALSPPTARYLMGRGVAAAGGGAGGSRQGPSSGGGLQSPASRAAAAAVMTAANAARAAGREGDSRMEGAKSVEDELGFANDKRPNRRREPTNDDGPRPIAGGDAETAWLRSFVQSLLGMRLPASDVSVVPTMVTPDPITALFYATSLLAKTAVARNGMTVWRPDDAYLAARALSLKGERKRAVWILDRAGLIGFGMGGDAGGGCGVKADRAESGSGSSDPGDDCFDHDNHDDNLSLPAISNEQGIRNALLLRAESALLAGQCLLEVGEHDRAIAVYEECMRFPPPPPPPEWGRYGYGYRPDNPHKSTEGEDEDGEEAGLDARLADEMYVRSWRERSMSHDALIDDGGDERLPQLAANLRPLSCGQGAEVEGIHPVARLCAARGAAYDEASNPHRAAPFLRAALAIDSRCAEALEHVVRRRLLTPEEEWEWMLALDFGSVEGPPTSLPWLRDAYMAKLRGGVACPLTTSLECSQEEAKDENAGDTLLGASPVCRGDIQSPSMFSLGSPDLANATCGEGRNHATTTTAEGGGLALDPVAQDASAPSKTVDEAFQKLAVVHGLGRSPDVLAHAAIRSHSAHDLRSALAYCSALDAIDPYCPLAGYIHVASLAGLGLRRRLFELAHRLVDADPRDALAWFAVGAYYHACGRHDLAQRHFSRSTRLDPGRAECWTGFGCSFAVCDESDQALASFRAAQGKHPGSHVPLLYMGMEYLRTNHLSLAGHFLTSAQKVDPTDVLCCNELGVWSFRQGDMEDASFWFVRALRLHVGLEVSALTSVDEALGMDGYILLNGHVSDLTDFPLRENEVINAPRSSRPDAERQISAVLRAVKTPAGRLIAASAPSCASDGRLTDAECIERCNDWFWEPTLFNLGQSYRKMNRYKDAIICFEKCSSLNPGNYAAYAALGFAKHLAGDVDGAIDSYHEALGRKPEDPFAGEMLARALAEAVTYPHSLAILSPSFSSNVVGQSRSGGVGSSMLNNRSGYSAVRVEQDSSMVSSSIDVDMSSSP